jgi:ATP-dependent DNA helicase RecG
LDHEDIDEIQKQIRGNCNRISPDYQPVISPEIYQGKKILVVWCPAGDLRPYQAPTGKKDRPYAYYVRQGAESVEARDETLTQLMQMTAKVPFDDRRNLEATIDVISPALVRNYLSDIGSSLVAPEVIISDLDLYRSLNLLRKVNHHEVPRNVALLFFTNNPEQFFPGARIEVVQFGDGAGGDLIEEKVFRGPIHHQLRLALDYLESLDTTMIKKVPNRAEARRWAAFPFEAMKEAVVNAVYHRSYDGVTEPIKVYLYPDRIEITSYPGPVPGIEKRHLEPGGTLPKVPYRNRRIGEFLKDLKLTEGRGTGVPKIRHRMKQNGSPDPVFDFDETRTYFTAVLPAHPRYIVIQALRESAHLWAIGERQSAIRALGAAVARVPASGALIAQLIRYRTDASDLAGAKQFFSTIESNPELADRPLPFLAMAKALLDHGQTEAAAAVLASMPAPSNADEAAELTVLRKRLATA